MNATLLKEYTTELSDGYMGAIKTTGSKSGEHLYGSELSKAVRQALQGVLAPELSKSDVRAKIQTYAGGQHLNITLRLDKNKYAPTRDEYKSMIIDDVKRDRYDWIIDGDGKQVFHEAYWGMADEEKHKAEKATAEQKAVWNYDQTSVDINHYYIDREEMLNDNGKEIVEVANRVIKAFNYDGSNSMVDYFDTNFYYDIKVEWK